MPDRDFLTEDEEDYEIELAAARQNIRNKKQYYGRLLARQRKPGYYLPIQFHSFATYSHNVDRQLRAILRAAQLEGPLFFSPYEDGIVMEQVPNNLEVLRHQRNNLYIFVEPYRLAPVIKRDVR